MRKIQNTMLKKLASASRFAAVKAAGSTSAASCYQPKEPAALKKIKK